MRKYIFNIPVLSAAFSFIGLAKTTQAGTARLASHPDVGRALAALGIAVGTVIEKNQEAEDY